MPAPFTAVRPTPVPSATPSPTALPMWPAGVLFYDNFGSRDVVTQNGWDLYESALSKREWGLGQLIISIKMAGSMALAYPAPEFEDFGVQTEVQLTGGDYAEYGLVLRHSTADNAGRFYLFGVTTDGRYYFAKRVGGQWINPAPVPYTASNAIYTGSTRNKLAALVEGSTIRLYINGVLVHVLADDSIIGMGHTGVFVSPGAQVPAQATFSYLIVLHSEKAKSIWAPLGTLLGDQPAPTILDGPPQPEPPTRNVAPPTLPPPTATRRPPTAVPAGPRYSAVQFSSAFDENAQLPINPAKTFAYGPAIIYAYWTYSGVTPGTPFSYFWYRDGVLLESNGERFINASGKAFQWYLVGMVPKIPLDPGTYQFVVQVGGRTVISDSLVIHAPPEGNPVPGAITVFFTIRNGSPWAWVYDKQGVRHVSADGVLALSRIPVAAGDRIIVRTDTPRFSLLFDCGTNPGAYSPCDIVADSTANLPSEFRVNRAGQLGIFNISRADNWGAERPGHVPQRYPADPVFRIVLGN